MGVEHGTELMKGSPHHGQPSSGQPVRTPVIEKGDKVLVKPNMIAQSHRYCDAWEHVITHGSVLRAAIDYIFLALGGEGKIIIAGIIGFVIILFLSYVISLWITQPIWELINYANSVKEGKRVSLPDLGKGEIKTLGESFENMRESLEGKKYIPGAMRKLGIDPKDVSFFTYLLGIDIPGYSRLYGRR